MIHKPQIKAPVITIIGSAGVGKTSLAALFPDPVFIQAENSETVFETWDEDIQPQMFEQLKHSNKKLKISTKNELLHQLRYVASNKDGFKTLIIDAVTTLSLMFEHEILEFDENDAKNMGDACGGYNKGFMELASMHAEIRLACEHIRKAGIAVVFLAHSGIQKMKNRPDSPEYIAYTIELPEKSRPFYIDHSDAVLYLKSTEYVTGSETDKKGRLTKYGKITNTGERVLITSSDGAVGFIGAKNRYNMPTEIEVKLGENPILQYIKFFNEPKQTTQSETQQPQE